MADIVLKQIGKPYAIGYEDKTTKKWMVKGKPSISNSEPADFDCSGLSRWACGQGMDENRRVIVLPHGCIEQLKFCEPLGNQRPRPFDLGFADLRGGDGAPDHVVIVIDNANVIEARGNPIGKVITRPIAAWEAQKGFLGFWSVPGIYK